MISFKAFIAESAGQDVWHGSKHDFHSFKREGTAHTGEGGAAYGSGIYVTSARGAAEHYRDLDKKIKSRKLYRVRMTTDPQRMMHWDKRVSEQSEHVKNALRDHHSFDWNKEPNPYARHVYQHIRKTHFEENGDRQKASSHATKFLQDRGVHGVTYAGDIHGKMQPHERPTNHVVFDPDSHLHIVARHDHLGHEVDHEGKRLKKG